VTKREENFICLEVWIIFYCSTALIIGVNRKK
jgi:hypothetical protein